jgi:hypothetical protein
MFENKDSIWEKIFPREIDVIIINKPLKSVYDHIKEHINERIDWGIKFGGFYIDESIHGKCYYNKIIYKVRPPFSQGIYYKTIINFESTSNEYCKLIVNRNSLKLYRNLWLFIIILSILLFFIMAISSNEYIVTSNEVSKIVEGHPYWLLGFPILLGIILFIFYFSIKSAKRKAEIFLNNIIFKLKSE